MHVLLLLPYLSRNGTERHALLLSRYLLSCGHQVTVAGPPGPMADEFQAAGAAVRLLPGISVGSFGRAMRLAARWAEDCDVVHAHAAQEFCWGLRWQGYRGPIVFTAHCYHDAIDYKKAGIFLNIPCQRVIAVSSAERDRLARGGVRRLETVLNGIDLASAAIGDRAAVRASVRAEFGVSSAHLLAVAVGRLEQPKGFVTILEALDRTDTNVVAIVAGDGAQRRVLERRAGQLGLADRVHFLGQRSDVWRLLSGSDVYVSASRREGLSLAALEALAVGLPLIVTDIPEFVEVARPEVNARLFGAGDAAGLARQLSELAGNAGLKARLGAASEQLSGEFSFEKMGERTLGIYRTAIEDKSASDA